MTPFLGQILLVPYNFAPSGYAPCEGQLLTINENTALFSLLGNTYGGDGLRNFALPDLRGRVPIHAGQGPGLSNVALGEHGGAEKVALATANLPPHTHPIGASSAPATTDTPTSAVVASGGAYGSTSDTTLAPSGATGSGTPIDVRAPYLGLTYVIALQGIFPSRN